MESYRSRSSSSSRRSSYAPSRAISLSPTAGSRIKSDILTDNNYLKFHYDFNDSNNGTNSEKKNKDSQRKHHSRDRGRSVRKENSSTTNKGSRKSGSKHKGQYADKHKEDSSEKYHKQGKSNNSQGQGSANRKSASDQRGEQGQETADRSEKDFKGPHNPQKSIKNVYPYTTSDEAKISASRPQSSSSKESTKVPIQKAKPAQGKQSHVASKARAPSPSDKRKTKHTQAKRSNSPESQNKTSPSSNRSKSPNMHSQKVSPAVRTKPADPKNIKPNASSSVGPLKQKDVTSVNQPSNLKKKEANEELTGKSNDLSSSDSQKKVPITKYDSKVTINPQVNVQSVITPSDEEGNILTTPSSSAGQAQLSPSSMSPSTISTNYEPSPTTSKVLLTRSLKKPCPHSKNQDVDDALQLNEIEEQDFISSTNTNKSSEQQSQIEQAMHGIVFLGVLDAQTRKRVINAMQIQHVREGDCVVYQGHTADCFYIVATGTFQFYILTDFGLKLVHVLHNHGSFGEISLLYNVPRQTTCVAASDGILFALDRATFRSVIVRAARLKWNYYREFILSMPMLFVLEPHEKLILANAMKTLNLQEGEYVYKQGDVADGMYFIVKGQVCLVTERLRAKSIVSVVTPKQNFGTTDVINKKKRTASAYAMQETELCFVQKDSVEIVLSSCYQSMKKSLASTTQNCVYVTK